MQRWQASVTSVTAYSGAGETLAGWMRRKLGSPSTCSTAHCYVSAIYHKQQDLTHAKKAEGDRQAAQGQCSLGFPHDGTPVSPRDGISPSNLPDPKVCLRCVLPAITSSLVFRSRLLTNPVIIVGHSVAAFVCNYLLPSPLTLGDSPRSHSQYPALPASPLPDALWLENFCTRKV